MFKNTDMATSLTNILGTVDEICDKFTGVVPKLVLDDEAPGK